MDLSSPWWERGPLGVKIPPNNLAVAWIYTHPYKNVERNKSNSKASDVSWNRAVADAGCQPIGNDLRPDKTASGRGERALSNRQDEFIR